MSYQRWYISLLVKHPYFVLLVICVFSCTCLILPFTVRTMKLPNFQDPQMGFSTRSTTISDRLTAWQNLQNEVSPSGYLVKNPKGYLMSKNMGNATSQSNEPYLKRRGGRRKQHKKQKDKFGTQNKIDDDHKNETVYGKVITNEKNSTDSPELSNKWQLLKNLTEHNHIFKRISYQKQFCGEPDEKYAHLVITTTNQENLFTWKNLQSLCKLEHILMNLKSVPELCISNTESDGSCCRPWSIPNYIAVMFDRHSCLSITESDVNKTIAVIGECSSYFHHNELYSNCLRREDCQIPLQCLKHDAVYVILNYLSNVNFFPPDNLDASKQKLEDTMLFLPIAASVASLPLYHEIENLSKEFEGLTIVAMDFGIKSMIFDEYLLQDTWFMALGAFFIFICVWMYTSSLFITVMVTTAILFAVAITYFLYEVIYSIPFFPFINILTVVICIGVGADNALILCKFWHLKKNDQSNDNDITKIMTGAFHHAFKSMFVTSLTTAVAFWGSYVSSVTAISCFSIFAGTSIIVIFLLTITWLPACLVIWEQTCLSNSIHPDYFMVFSPVFCCFKSRCLTSMWNGKKEFLISAVIKLRYFWIICFTAIATTSTYIVFIDPGLNLPSTIDFQLFQSSHPFEKYDFIYRNKFWFKREKADHGINDYKMPLSFVWGVLPVDNGDHLNPANLGSLELDPNFDMTDPASQVWLRNFCNEIKLQPFYQPILGVSLTSCFIETFVTSMNRRCIDDFSKKDRSPCCNVSSFPFSREVFNVCILEEMSEIYGGPAKYLYPKTAGVMFSKEDIPAIKAVVVEFESSVTFSMSYDIINDYYNQVSEWAKVQLLTAPHNMRNGFFVSELGFYDLQRELSRGTKVAIFLSMVLSSGVLIVSTLNPLLTALAIITITFSIITTIASLVLCGWTLNILESVAISTAIGLAVDFSLHYCISYKLCPPNFNRDRKDATRYALSCLMGPSFMAGFTTAAAGFFMTFSLILPYFQIGLFLVLIMTISWLYATFFFGSLLITMGPTPNCCQYTYTEICRRILHSRSKSITRGNNEPITTSSSTRELDRVSFIKHDTPVPVKKKSSFKEPYVRYTSSQGLDEQSPSSNITIIMPDIMHEDN